MSSVMPQSRMSYEMPFECHIMMYVMGPSGYRHYVIKSEELEEKHSIPLDMHIDACNKTIQFGPQCLIVMRTDEYNVKIHTLYEIPRIPNGNTYDYVQILANTQPDIQEGATYVYFIL